MVTTILDVLLSPNPSTIDLVRPGGSNTEAPDWIPVDTWTKWDDFNYEILYKLYSTYLNKPAGSVHQRQPLLFNDRVVTDEKTCEAFLGQYIMPAVNNALDRILGEGSPYIGAGSTVGSTADWAARVMLADGTFEPLFPGDTKLAQKWYPELERLNHTQWSLPVSQVLTYAHYFGSRYGFIITQSGLVVLRFCREPICEGSALDRTRRAQPTLAFHQRVGSGDTNMSSAIGDTSFNTGDSSYPEQPNEDFYPPSYCSVPWGAHGKTRLTIKLALTCLCLLARTGPNDVRDTDYPPLDSWQTAYPTGFIHTSTGERKKRLKVGDVFYEEAIPCESEPDNVPTNLEESLMINHSTEGTEQTQAVLDHGDPGPSFYDTVRHVPGRGYLDFCLQRDDQRE